MRTRREHTVTRELVPVFGNWYDLFIIGVPAYHASDEDYVHVCKQMGV